MTVKMADMANPRKAAPDSVAGQLIEQARAGGLSLVGPGSPLQTLTKQVLETALEAETGRASGLRARRPARQGGRHHGQRAQRHQSQGSRHRVRPSEHRGAPGSGRQL